MGPGWFQPRHGNPYKAPIVRAQLEIGNGDEMTIIPTDSTWRVADSCISQVGSWSHNNFGGERWDARRYVDSWNRADFNDSGWAQALEIPAPAVIHSWQALPGSRLGPPQPPQRIYRHDGRWVLDFGKNFTGWLRCRFAGLEPGQEISIHYADLDPDQRHLMHVPNKTNGFQTFNQKDVYIAGDRSEDVFCSKFSHHGFRYAVISGLSKAPETNDAVAMMITTDLPPAGEFRCSNELYNRIHEVTVRSYLTQAPAGVLGGGETREHLGYGDGGSFLSGFLYNLKSDAFFRKWLRDWRDNQRDDGFFGHVAPEFYPAGGGPSWCGQASELVRRLHLYHGDRRAVEESYAALQRFLDFLEHQTKEDLLTYYNPYKPGKWVKWYFLGDWTPPGTDPDKDQFIFETPEQQTFFNNCYRILLWDQLAAYAEILGDAAGAVRCRKRLADLRSLVHKTWWDGEKKTYRVNRQAYLVIALLSGVVPEELRPEILRQLEEDIVVAKDGHLDTGLQGTFMLLDLLTRENRPDLVARIMNQTRYPSWGFLLEERGVTTWPETWSGWGSQIIQVTGTPGAWFYEGLAGIRPDWKHPGFKHFTLQPGVVNSVDWVKCSYKSPYGKIVSNWQIEDGCFKWNITVPPNSTATIHLPGQNITEGGLPADKAEGLTFLRKERGKSVFRVGSGTYELLSVVK
jgi:alpha-L-rhamnosidase